MIGLCGSHRVGKTTLALEFASEVEIPFVQTQASSVFERMGLNPAADYPLDIRFEVQHEILSEAEQQYAEAGRVFVTDRTPIDMMAYTLADIRNKSLTTKGEEVLQEYLKRCVAVTNRFFSILVVVQPGIELRPERGKAALSQGYIEHISRLVMGLVVSEEIHANHYYIPKRIVSLEERVQCLHTVLNKTVMGHRKAIEQAEAAGRPIVFH